MNYNCLILNYHAVIEIDTQQYHLDPIYTIRRNLFRKHLELFDRLKLNVVTLDEIGTFTDDSRLTVCLTFDDGYSTDYEIVAPLLNEYNYKATFFPSLSNFKNKDKRWKEYYKLAKAGHSIGAHGVNHNYLSNLSTQDQFYELNFSKKFIENIIGKPVDFFALPFGNYNEQTIQLANEIGYKGILTTEFGFINANNLPYIIDRWSLKKRISITKLEKVLRKDHSAITKIKFEKRFKRNLSLILSNRLTNKLNYLINH